jgi:RNA polymerase sigma-70 factor, ECF subfamily
MEAGIEEIFKAYSAMVHRVCLRYVRNREEAEDLTQEVFLKVDRGLAAFKAGSAVSTWVYRIAINTCLDHLRVSKRRDELLEECALDEAVLRNLSFGGDRELARIDLDRLLRHAKPEIREYLFLTQLEGLSYEQAAEVTGKSAFAIAQAVSRFRKSSRVRLWMLEKLGFRQKSAGGSSNVDGR